MPSNLPEIISGLKTLLERVDQLKAALDSLRPLDAEQEARVMQKFRLDWNYHSNSIEGNSLTYGETIAFLMEGLTAKGKPFKDHLDIRGHNDAINYLMEMIKNYQELSEKAIRELHRVILVEPYKTPAQTQDGLRVEKEITLGAYKKMPNHVKTPTGEIHYYATPEETPSKMADLMAWLREEQVKKELHPLAIAAIFHYRFVDIHPFDDGNGRMSRLLMNLLLMQDGYPPVVIKQEERNLYYNALRQADAGDLASFVEFIGENLLHSLEIYLKGAKGESIEDEGDLDKEIALFKKGFKSEPVVKTIKDITVVNNLIEKSILPFFEQLKEDCLKLKDMFHSVSFIIDFQGSGLSTEGKYEHITNKDNFDQYWVNELKGKWSDIHEIIFRTNWQGFLHTVEPSDIHQDINIKLDKYKYKFNQGKIASIPHIEKLYHQEISKAENYELRKSFINAIMEQINRQSKGI